MIEKRRLAGTEVAGERDDRDTRGTGDTRPVGHVASLPSSSAFHLDLLAGQALGILHDEPLGGEDGGVAEDPGSRPGGVRPRHHPGDEARAATSKDGYQAGAPTRRVGMPRLTGAVSGSGAEQASAW